AVCMDEVFLRELENIEIFIKSTRDRRLLERYQAIKLFFEGHSIVYIAKIIGRSPSTVASYVRIYSSEGIAGLARKPSPGRPAFLTKNQKEQLKQMISLQSPENSGFPGEQHWTCSLIVELIYRQFNVKYSTRGVLDLLHAMQFEHTHQTYTLVKLDAKNSSS
ncbi:MAG TPA: helix-turn-helix domain-containing protein, partial [Patescibacteria group bacterium]|nr:helix-turn-helix domain-containing protein [Patescibacteria group bacterium]